MRAHRDPPYDFAPVVLGNVFVEHVFSLDVELRSLLEARLVALRSSITDEDNAKYQRTYDRVHNTFSKDKDVEVLSMLIAFAAIGMVDIQDGRVLGV